MQAIEYAGDQMAKEYKFWLVDQVMVYRGELFAAYCSDVDTDEKVARVKEIYRDIHTRVIAYAPKF